MKRLFVSAKYHDDVVLGLESELVCTRKANEGLVERIAQGEAYRAQLERENRAVLAANMQLHSENGDLILELEEAKREAKQQRLLRESLEAMIGRHQEETRESA